jgi:alkylhydroperoxidase/carboxymuconolactone decarboxylase family protein YurZ
MSEVSTPVLDSLLAMNEGVLDRSGLDPQTFMLLRIAALAATGAPPESYLVNLETASELGLTAEHVEGVLICIAPVIGSARVAGAGNSMAQALGLAVAISEE